VGSAAWWPARLARRAAAAGAPRPATGVSKGR
jgi:hypothetical protein